MFRISTLAVLAVLSLSGAMLKASDAPVRDFNQNPDRTKATVADDVLTQRVVGLWKFETNFDGQRMTHWVRFDAQGKYAFMESEGGQTYLMFEGTYIVRNGEIITKSKKGDREYHSVKVSNTQLRLITDGGLESNYTRSK